uniref:Ig-like domain-containing protein n=1 Tax=Urocitellus parryii TaxID=9999 RepID=A0A8D2KL97_UROPR
MHPEVVVLSLILLLTDAVVSYTQVSGVVGHPVIIPCSYSVASGVTSMCWGQGACPTSKCSNELIWTDGSQVTFRKHRRYKLEGNLLQGNVSLTIENAAKTDSGLYCCRIEHSGWFNDMKLTLSLEIKPGNMYKMYMKHKWFYM